MKLKNLLLASISILIAGITFGQAPEGFKYQAVVRDVSSNILANQLVGMQLTIIQGALPGTAVYTETFATTTNGYGLVNLEIGKGTTSDNFSTIDWANGPYFIETAVDVTGGTSYAVMGTSQLMSVPYALHAKTADNVINGFSGDYNDLTNQPTIPTVPTNVSDFNNDANYLTTEVDGSTTNEIQVLSISSDTIYLSNGGFAKLPAGFDGDYNSLTNQPTIPTVPTNVSTFTNDAGYLDGTMMTKFKYVYKQFTAIIPAAGGPLYDNHDDFIVSADPNAYIVYGGYTASEVILGIANGKMDYSIIQRTIIDGTGQNYTVRVVNNSNSVQEYSISIMTIQVTNAIITIDPTPIQPN